jgi:ribosome recycling factor
MHPLLSEKKGAFDAAITHLQKELSSLRTGRANPSLVESIPVSAYGSVMEVKAVASISVPDARTIIIDPWDKSLVQAVEKAIRDADIGLSPAVDGGVVRLNIPSMTEETRKKLVKVLHERLEECRVGIRQIREKAREETLRMEKEKRLGEDEKFKMLDELDKMTKDFTARAEEVGAKKEKEIMTV